MPQLPPRPSLAHLKSQAKDLLKALQGDDAEALARLEAHFRDRDRHRREAVNLAAAQFVVAREYGFGSWPALTAYVRLVGEYGSYAREEEARPGLAKEEQFLLLACLTYAVDHPSRREKARAMLAEDAALAKASIYTAAVLGDLEGVRHWLVERPGLARQRGGPLRWEPLLYLAYSRLDGPGAEPLEVAKLLLAHGADPNAGFLWEGFSSPFTVLTGIFGEGEAGPVNQPRHPQEKALARLMLEAGADPNDGQTLYNRQFTRGTGHLELLFEYGLGKPGKPGKGPWAKRLGEKARDSRAMLEDQLFWAAEWNDTARLALLARHGVDCNATGRRKVAGRWREQSVYEAAMVNGNREAAELLLRLGARRVELAPLEMLEMLEAACARGDLAAAREVLKPGLLEQLGEERQSRMMVDAAAQGKLEAVRCMVALGFPLAPPDGSATPLHQAAWFGHREIAELLVSLGADRSARDKGHKATPAEWAAFNHQPELAAFLKE